jgi:hypothetical protein
MMSENQEAKDLRTQRRISLEQEYEIRYWTKSLRVTEEYLRQLVAKYGPYEMAIRDALRHTAA